LDHYLAKGLVMERKWKIFWILALVVATSGSAFGKQDPWEGLIKKLIGKSKDLYISSSRTAQKLTPKVVGFRGEVQIPSSLKLSYGVALVNSNAAQLIFDGSVLCQYSPKSKFSRTYSFVSCSDGSRSGDAINVQSKIEVRLNYAASENATILAIIKVLRVDEVEYGIVFPYVKAEEGQVLAFNGEAWVPTNVSELIEDQSSVAGTPGPQGEQGPMGPVGAQGPAGPQGPQGPQGEKGEKGDKGDTGVAGPAGATGAVGPMGPAGPAGIAGAAGAMGPVGPQGPAGDRGSDGAPGAQGPAGAAGPQGAQGPQGLQGAQGEQGLQGAPGPAGAQGPQGPKGDKGEQGERGLSEVAYLRDERNSGVNGGSCLGTVWNTRALNVLGGSTGFISLASNRFTLQPGKYFIEASAPAFQTGGSRIKLKVIETGEDVLIGSVAFSATTNPTVSKSEIQGEVIISVASTFEIQQRCQVEKLSNGFGPAASFGVKEVYTQVKITKTE